MDNFPLYQTFWMFWGDITSFPFFFQWFLNFFLVFWFLTFLPFFFFFLKVSMVHSLGMDIWVFFSYPARLFHASIPFFLLLLLLLLLPFLYPERLTVMSFLIDGLVLFSCRCLSTKVKRGRKQFYVETPFLFTWLHDVSLSYPFFFFFRTHLLSS